MASNFEDIRIVGMDEAASRNPNPEKRLYDVVLTLSASAPADWAEYFNKRWEHEIYSMKRRATVSGRRLVIHCALEELEQDHLPRLREVVAETNSAYRQYLTREERLDSAARAREQSERDELRQIKDRLKFD
jgi:hypothetical protein